VPKEAKQSYIKSRNIVINKNKTSVNPQTNKGMLPPHMVTKRKTHIFSFQPPKRRHLNLFQELHGRVGFICKESMVPFIPKDPNTTKPNQRQEWPTRSITTWRVNKIAKRGQWIIRWSIVSFWPHPETHNWLSIIIMPRRTKLSFVGHLLRKRRHAQIETFKGTLLCQGASETTSWLCISCLMSIWYTPRTL
jgi:hypothetical protein